MSKNDTTAMFQHCQTIYNAMNDRAEEKTEGRIYEGSLSQLFNEIGLGVTYYTPVMNRLKQMGCAEQLRRGGGPSPSLWALHYPPTTELFERARETASQRQQAPARSDLEQRHKDMNRRLRAVEDWARTQGAPL